MLLAACLLPHHREFTTYQTERTQCGTLCFGVTWAVPRTAVAGGVLRVAGKAPRIAVMILTSRRSPPSPRQGRRSTAQRWLTTRGPWNQPAANRGARGGERRASEGATSDAGRGGHHRPPPPATTQPACHAHHQRGTSEATGARAVRPNGACARRARTLVLPPCFRLAAGCFKLLLLGGGSCLVLAVTFEVVLLPPHHHYDGGGAAGGARLEDWRQMHCLLLSCYALVPLVRRGKRIIFTKSFRYSYDKVEYRPWLHTSTPSFTTVRTATSKYYFPQNAVDNGDEFLCVNFSGYFESSR